jgi:hypothetical protein
MKKLLIILAIVVAAAGFGIYKLVNTLSKASDLGDAAVADYHAEYNANRAATIRAASAPAFQKEVTAEEWNNLHAMLHGKLGAWVSGHSTGVSVETNNGNDTLHVKYSSKFEKGEASEEFIFDYNGSDPLLLHYEVKSDALKGPAPAAADSTEKAAAAGEEAVASFHEKFNAGDAAAIHTASAPAFQKDVDPAKWKDLQALLQEKLGAWKSGERTVTNVKTANGLQTLEMTWSAIFEKGEGTEEFIFDYSGGKPLLLSYNVKSDALKEPPPSNP